MCRLFGFRSAVESHAHQSLVDAENALAHQSERHPDGWGVAYYVHSYPHVFRGTERAMGSKLFREVSGLVSTTTLLAHIRKATVGEVSLLNTHPFQFANWVFAHNGEVAGFAADPDVREAVRREVDERFRGFIMGATDSEVCFYVFLSRLARRVDGLHARGIEIGLVSDSLRETAERVRAISDWLAGKPSMLTFLVTNGNLMVGYREGRELHFSTHKTRCPDRDACHAFAPELCEAAVAPGGRVNHLVLASEQVAIAPNVWGTIADGAVAGVDWGMRLYRAGEG
jgi:glutamine amidotransferase